MTRYLRRIKKYNLVMLILLAGIGFGNIMSTRHSAKHKVANQNIAANPFSGSLSCMPCHKDIYASHIKTAHYLTSRPAAREFIKGSFDSGRNHFTYNKFMEVVLRQQNDSFFQTSFVNGVEMQTESFDIVIGSGRKGQTYLYWYGSKLFQLPVSYYKPLDSWCNSPGYSINYIRFNRQIPGQCIECHGTYAKVEDEKETGSIYDKDQIIYGVDCERCHGPGAEHVTFHTNNPNEKAAKFIINAKHLTRQQRLDACALCHSGFRKETQPPFSFQVGGRLDDYSIPGYKADSMFALDVHGNQYGLLTSSKCFKMSEMDCSSCHNVHVNEYNSPKIFSQRCMNCHNEGSHKTCTVQPVEGLTLSDNCIDCHMPALPSKKIFLQLSDPNKSTPDLVRTHRVGIYPKNAQDFIEKVKSKNGSF